jgi:hypothetical protein
VNNGFRFAFLALAVSACLTVASCALTATRPVQEMSDTSAAIRAAKEVQADTLAPELYRQANEWFFKARKEYKFKNFSFADEFAKRARKFAEQAEFEAIKNGGNRTDAAPPDQASTPPTPAPPPTPAYNYPTPEGTPADVYDERKSADDARKAAEEKAAASRNAAPGPTDTPGILAPPPIIVNGQYPAPTHT